MEMMKELMWIYGVINQEIIDNINEICRECNKDLFLSERYLNFPLHVSFKRSFYTDRFSDIKEEVIRYMKKHSSVNCGPYYLERYKDLLWLRFTDEEKLNDIHNELDELLVNEYGIPLDEYDHNYAPHVTLFRNPDEDKLDMMYERIKDRIIYKPIVIDKIIIGSRTHENETINIDSV